MARDAPESDWMKLRALHPLALDRLSKRNLDEIRAIADDETMSNHGR